MDAKMSAAVVITLASNLASFVSFILWCIFYSFIITLHDFHSCFRQVFDLLSYLLEYWKSLCRFRSKNEVPPEDVLISKPCPTVEVTGEDVEVVMEKLGLARPREPLLQDSFEIVNMFDDREASLDEVREAFGVFDENNDGFIDAAELKKVMSSLGFAALCEEECQRMIMAFDVDGDGRIDFGEFVKLI